MNALDRLVEHVGQQCGQRARMAGKGRVRDLTRLVVRHWPHHHLEAIRRSGSRSHADLDHAMALVRAQVREQHEARHGVGPLWNLFLSGLVAAISHVVLELWFHDACWRVMLRGLSRQIGEERLPADGQH